ncbi:sugar dehydrogenase complex small subunit [Polaromonas sp. UC242_47]|uniref:sugar dehydrogenase complex small subunit n=1 Tax=Polaromonas sp. UC242_47 TaxID=3374626 RepID=UPI0037B148FA
MKTLDDLLDNAASPSQPTRRVLLVGLLSAYTASLIPWALAQPVAGAEQGSFVAVSALLAGRQALDNVLATRLYDALKADDPGFPAATKALLTLINERKIDPLQLQQLLDSEQSPLAALPRKIVTAWYMGIVGNGDKARCLAYEHALNAAVVEDILKPPTYSYGVYASWEKKPT